MMEQINNNFLLSEHAITKIPIVDGGKHKHDVLYNMLSQHNNGFFVDVGASSNGGHTKFFEDSGWNGLCIEPIDSLYEKLTAYRKCECISACIYSECKKVDFMENTGYTCALSGICETYSQNHVNRIQREDSNPANHKIIEKQTTRLKDLFSDRNITIVDYLKIDTEGSELDVLKSVDFDAVTVNLIDCENNYPHTGYEIEKYLLSIGFILINRLKCDDSHGKNCFPHDLIFLNTNPRFSWDPKH